MRIARDFTPPYKFSWLGDLGSKPENVDDCPRFWNSGDESYRNFWMMSTAQRPRCLKSCCASRGKQL